MFSKRFELMLEIVHFVGGRKGMTQVQEITEHINTLNADMRGCYLQQLCKDLVKAGIFSSKRGKDGGYCMDRTSVTVLEILDLAEGHYAPFGPTCRKIEVELRELMAKKDVLKT